MTFSEAFIDELAKLAESLPLSPTERADANRRYSEAKKGFGSGDGCSPGKTKKGYNFHTHRAGTGNYPSFSKIPLKKIRFVGTTA